MYINLINLDGDGDTYEAHRIYLQICTFLLYASMGPRYANIMFFAEDLCFLFGMTTVFLQKT